MHNGLCGTAAPSQSEYGQERCIPATVRGLLGFGFYRRDGRIRVRLGQRRRLVCVPDYANSLPVVARSPCRSGSRSSTGSLEAGPPTSLWPKRPRCSMSSTSGSAQIATGSLEGVEDLRAKRRNLRSFVSRCAGPPVGGQPKGYWRLSGSAHSVEPCRSATGPILSGADRHPCPSSSEHWRTPDADPHVRWCGRGWANPAPTRLAEPTIDRLGNAPVASTLDYEVAARAAGRRTRTEWSAWEPARSGVSCSKGPLPCSSERAARGRTVRLRDRTARSRAERRRLGAERRIAVSGAAQPRGRRRSPGRVARQRQGPAAPLLPHHAKGQRPACGARSEWAAFSVGMARAVGTRPMARLVAAVLASAILIWPRRPSRERARCSWPFVVLLVWASWVRSNLATHRPAGSEQAGAPAARPGPLPAEAVEYLSRLDSQLELPAGIARRFGPSWPTT